MSTFRFGIVGFGRFAEKTILPALRLTPGVEVVAVHNRSREKAREIAARHGIPHSFDTVDGLVHHPDVDGIFSVSANSVHCDDTVLAAAAGKHVLVEKPMALNVREAHQMIAACREGGVTLMVGHMVRLSPLIRRLREIIDAGSIGRVTYAQADFTYDGRASTRTWLTNSRIAGGGPLFDVGVHCIDTLRYVLNDEPVEIRATLIPSPGPETTETDALVSLRFSRDIVGASFSSYNSSIRKTRIEISGTDGLLFADEFTRPSGRAVLHWRTGKGDTQFDERLEEFDVSNLYVQEITQFIRSIREGTPLELSGENGLANQRILDEALADARRSKR